MSDLMLFGVLQMPQKTALANEVSSLQFYARAQEAVKRIKSDAIRIEELENALAASKADALRWNQVIKNDAIDAIYGIVLGNMGDKFNIDAEFDRYIQESL